ncbi:LytR C-terminal domain-containing protein [Nocardia thailandica]|uniref:LytR C-terminal domain-containing protein n=1 Tax=Nocardia thailandica TaxID=257275 RepID=A0ABW6PQH4_9NOCA
MSNPNPTPGGPPLRALAMVLIALAIVFAGLGAMSLSNSESSAAQEQATEAPASSTTSAVAQVPATTASSTAAPVTTTPPAVTTTTAAPTTTSTAASGGGDRAVPVKVLNNSMVAGLAARTANELTADGWTNVSTGNYSGANLSTTTVYYGPGAGDKAAATAVAAEVGGTVAPKTSGYSDNAPGVVVILTGS